MYINPFIAGILVTVVFIETGILVFAYMIGRKK